MTHMSRWWGIALGALLGIAAAPAARAQRPCQQLGAGGDVLTRARQERRILSDLDQSQGRLYQERRLNLELWRQAAEDDPSLQEQYREMVEDEGSGDQFDLTLGMIHRGENLLAFPICDGRGGQLDATLERNWFGVREDASARFALEEHGEKVRQAQGVGLFFLRSVDGLEFREPGFNSSVDYARSLLGGYVHGDYLGGTLALYTRTAPDSEDLPDALAADPELPGALGLDQGRERSVYFNLGVPRWGVSVDLVGIPGTRRGADLTQLNHGGVWLPGDVRLDASLGWMWQRQRLFGGVALEGLLDQLTVQAGAESAAPYFKFALARWEPRFLFQTIRQYPDYRGRPQSQLHSWVLSPFVQASIIQDELWAGAGERTGWRVGGEAGVAARYVLTFLTVGVSAHVGLNDADDLLVLPEAAGHFKWGTSVFWEFGI